jgi:hypothetical protein
LTRLGRNWYSPQLLQNLSKVRAGENTAKRFSVPRCGFE